MKKLGIEMEMVVAQRDSGRSHVVAAYFDGMARRKRDRGFTPWTKTLAGRQVAVGCEGYDSGLDNAFNHLESALGPVAGGAGGLGRLEAMVRTELSDVLDTLALEGAVLLNASEHPDCRLDEDFYRSVRAPKPIYDYWVGYRGWSHRVGIDAKAQNGSTTSVPVAQGARALNVMLAVAPAMIALSANSPLEGGVVTGLKENRLSLWPRMFAGSRFARGDIRLASTPETPFADLAAYFRWAYGEGTVMHSVPLAFCRDYKGASATARPLGDPSLLRFLSVPTWAALRCDTGEPVVLTPSAAHFEHLQFTPFLDARFRFRFRELPPVADLHAALAVEGGLEALLARCATDTYVEGRAPGANFPDDGLLKEIGAEHAASVVMWASALQAGLLANLDAAEALVHAWQWQRLRALRERAVADALHDADVHAFAGEVLAVAEAGLDEADRARLVYAKWVWANRRTGADRTLETWHALTGDASQRLAALAHDRRVVHPRQWTASPPGRTQAGAPAAHFTAAAPTLS